MIELPEGTVEAMAKARYERHMRRQPHLYPYWRWEETNADQREHYRQEIRLDLEVGLDAGGIVLFKDVTDAIRKEWPRDERAPSDVSETLRMRAPRGQSRV